MEEIALLHPQFGTSASHLDFRWTSALRSASRYVCHGTLRSVVTVPLTISRFHQCRLALTIL